MSNVNCVRSDLRLLSGESRATILQEGAEAVVPRTDDGKVTGRPWHSITPTKTQGEEIMKVMLAVRQNIWQNTC